MSADSLPDVARAHHLLTTTLSQPREGEILEKRLVDATVRVLDGPDEGATYTLPYPRALGGRGEHVDIPLTDASVSATHFELTFADHVVYLRDLGSRNGTWVGRARLEDRIQLHDGAEFHAGGCGLRVDFGGERDRPITTSETFHGMRATSLKMRQVFALLARVAPLPLSVLLLGETGTGKEEAARALHLGSGRTGPFEVLDCSGIPRDLAESTIHGHAKGAFTGAVNDRPGAFEQADGGTLLLDEIGELPLDMQTRLLRVLDRREVQRVGETKVRPVDVRVLAATNRDLKLEVAAGRFRPDLYHRLVLITVELPPLREHADDVGVLARHFLQSVSAARGRTFTLSAEAIALLGTQPWPGNIRELKAVIERSGYLARDTQLGVSDIVLDPSGSRSVEDERLLELPLKQALELVTDRFCRDYCQRLLARFDSDLDRLAAHAGYSRKGLRELMRRVGLRVD
jgi:DNA-binding NtrC family response regulator